MTRNERLDVLLNEKNRELNGLAEQMRKVVAERVNPLMDTVYAVYKTNLPCEMAISENKVVCTLQNIRDDIRGDAQYGTVTFYTPSIEDTTWAVLPSSMVMEFMTSNGTIIRSIRVAEDRISAFKAPATIGPNIDGLDKTAMLLFLEHFDSMEACIYKMIDTGLNNLGIPA